MQKLTGQNLPGFGRFRADGKLKISGRGSAWLERLVRDQEVGGSNPLAPTTLIDVKRTRLHETRIDIQRAQSPFEHPLRPHHGTL